MRSHAPSGWYTCALARVRVRVCGRPGSARAVHAWGARVRAASAAPWRRAAARRARVQRSRSAGSCVCARMRAPRAPAWRVHQFSARGSALAVVGTLAATAGIVAWVHEMQRDERDKLRKGLARDKAMLAKKRAERGLPPLPE